MEPSAEESLAFTEEEATYYGDLFGAERSMFACIPSGGSSPDRTCGTSDSCAIEIVGACDELCDASGCRDDAGNTFAATVTVNLDDRACP